MLVSHLINLSKNLPGIFNLSANIFVIDEANNLESKFRNAYTRKMSESQFKYELTAAEKRLKKNKPVKEVQDMFSDLFESLRNDISVQRRNAEGDMQAFYFNQGKYVKNLLFDIRRALVELEKRLGYEMTSLAFLREICNI